MNSRYEARFIREIVCGRSCPAPQSHTSPGISRAATLHRSIEKSRNIVTQSGGAMSCLQTVTSEPLSTSAASAAVELSWFAVQTFPRHEKKVTAELQEKSVQTFLPLVPAKHQWSDRQRLVDEPIFPGYTFVRIVQSLSNRIAILRTKGLARFVGVRGVGIPIPDDQIECVQTALARRIPFGPHPFSGVGRRIRIRGGCFEGVEGILAAINGNQTLVISVDLIQRSIAIRVAGYRIEAV